MRSKSEFLTFGAHICYLSGLIYVHLSRSNSGIYYVESW